MSWFSKITSAAIAHVSAVAHHALPWVLLVLVIVAAGFLIYVTRARKKSAQRRYGRNPPTNARAPQNSQAPSRAPTLRNPPAAPASRNPDGGSGSALKTGASILAVLLVIGASIWLFVKYVPAPPKAPVITSEAIVHRAPVAEADQQIATMTTTPASGECRERERTIMAKGGEMTDWIHVGDYCKPNMDPGYTSGKFVMYCKVWNEATHEFDAASFQTVDGSVSRCMAGYQFVAFTSTASAGSDPLPIHVWFETYHGGA